MARQESNHWWFMARRAILRKFITRYAPSRKNLDILEAGCGTGGNLEFLSEFGTVYGFELNEEACKLASRSSVSVRQGHLPDGNPFADQKFDVIALFDVLEHVKEDRESLQALSACLKPGGRLFITVPSLPVLWSQHDIQHHHFRRYLKRSLRTILEGSGFKVIRLSHYNFFLSPFIAAIRIVHRCFPSDKSDDEIMPPRWLNRLLYRIFSAEGRLLMGLDLPIGVSLIVVAEALKEENLQEK